MRVLFAPVGAGDSGGKASVHAATSAAMAWVDPSDSAPDAPSAPDPSTDAPAPDVAMDAPTEDAAPEVDPAAEPAPATTQQVPARAADPFDGIPAPVRQFMARQARELADLRKRLEQPAQPDTLVNFLKEEREQRAAQQAEAAKKAAAPVRPEFDDPLEGEVWDLKQHNASLIARLEGYDSKFKDHESRWEKRELERKTAEYQADYSAHWASCKAQFPMAEHASEAVFARVQALRAQNPSVDPKQALSWAAKKEHERLDALFNSRTPAAPTNTPAPTAMQRGPAPSVVPRLAAPGTASAVAKPRITTLSAAREAAMKF